MKNLTITLAPAAQAPNPTLVYSDVVNWDWNQMDGLQILLEDDVSVLLNTTYVIAVVEKEELEPEQAQDWDIDEVDEDVDFGPAATE